MDVSLNQLLHIFVNYLQLFLCFFIVRIWLATSSKDKTVRVWRVSDGVCVAVGEGHTDSVGCVGLFKRDEIATSSSKQAFVVSGSGDKILKRWTLPLHLMCGGVDQSVEQQRLAVSHSVRAHDKDINTVVVAPNDGLVASGSQDKTVRIWRGSDLSALATLSGHKRGIWRVAFSPVDRCLVSCSGDRTLRLWSMVDYSCLRTFEGHAGSVLSVKFVNKGMQLLSGSADGLIRLWTLRTGECENTFDEHEDKVWALAVPPDVVAATATEQVDLRLAPLQFFSGGSDSRLLVWDDITRQEEEGRLVALEKDMILEQDLQNDLHNKRYGKVMSCCCCWWMCVTLSFQYL